MCDVCGCGDPRKITIDVHASLLSENDREAAHLREHFASRRVLALNLMGSPGSGKTALIEAVASWLSARRAPLRLAAVSGDLATSLDAERLARAGVPSGSITTGSACHLDASMVHHALHGPLAAAVGACDVFFIENVGNLVCTANFALGAHLAAVVASVPEGHDKPYKYPGIYAAADVVVLNKADLTAIFEFDVDYFRRGVSMLIPTCPVFVVSSRSGAGMDEWVAWLEERRVCWRR